MKVKLRSKLTKQGYSLYLDLYKDGKRTFEFLDTYVSEDYTSQKGLKNIKSQDKDNMLFARELCSRRQSDLNHLEHGMVSQKRKNADFLVYFDICYKERKKAHATFSNTLVHLRAFVSERCPISSVSTTFLNNFHLYLKSVDRVSNNTIATYMNRLKQILDECVKDNIIAQNPFNQFDMRALNRETVEPEICFLTIEELKLMQAVPSRTNTLRCAFHHESIEFSRKTENVFFELHDPRLALILSGTPEQIRRLFISVENGLFSRFLFYYIDIETTWKDVFEDTETDFEAQFKQLGEDVLKFYLRLTPLSKPIRFSLTQPQQAAFNAAFSKWQNEIGALSDNELIATIRRLGLICFRIAMQLSVLRLTDNNADLPTEIICSDLDFKTAFRLTEVFKTHAVFVFDFLGTHNKHKCGLTGHKLAWYNELTHEFKRLEAVNLGKNHQVEPRTVDRLLAKHKLFSKLDDGKYQKLN